MQEEAEAAEQLKPLLARALVQLSRGMEAVLLVLEGQALEGRELVEVFSVGAPRRNHHSGRSRVAHLVVEVVHSERRVGQLFRGKGPSLDPRAMRSRASPSQLLEVSLRSTCNFDPEALLDGMQIRRWTARAHCMCTCT